MFRLQKAHPNMNMTKFQVSNQENDLVLALNHLMILMNRFVRKTGKNLKKQQKVLPVSSNLFQPLFQVLLLQNPCFLSSYCFIYCFKCKFIQRKFFMNNSKQSTETIK